MHNYRILFIFLSLRFRCFFKKPGFEIIEVIEIDQIFRKREPQRGSGGWFGGKEGPSSADGGRYMVGPLFVYDEPETRMLSPDRADGARSSAWDWYGGLME